MIWTVEWIPDAENELAAIWIYAPDRKVITRAADLVDQRLANNPDQQGVPWKTWRVLFEAPLAVTFAVYPHIGHVEVVKVERISQ